MESLMTKIKVCNMLTLGTYIGPVLRIMNNLKYF